MSDPRDYLIDTGTAAGLLRISRQRVRQLIESGALAARKIGPGWLLRVPDVEAYAARIRERYRFGPQERGRPPSLLSA